MACIVTASRRDPATGARNSGIRVAERIASGVEVDIDIGVVIRGDGERGTFFA